MSLVNNVKSSALIYHVPQSIVSEILLSTGELFNLSRVCKLFKTIAEQKGKEVLSRLEQSYGKLLLNFVFQKLPQKNSSLLAKLDSLFHFAKISSDPLGLKPDAKMECAAYSALKLQDYMDAYIEMESLLGFWKAICQQAPPDLKIKIAQVKFNDDPRIAMKEVRSFLHQNRALLNAIEHLNLRNLNLKMLPPEIILFPNLLTLDVSNNHLVRLPLEISKLSKLTTLRVDSNRLTSLPQGISNLKCLIYFSCAKNNFSSFPQQIIGLTQLKFLVMHDNNLFELPKSIKQLSSLRILSLENNKIQQLPDCISNLNLEGLYLYNNQLKNLPESICKIQTLIVLSVPNNQLTDLPENIGEFKKLSKLILDNNSLTKLPDSIADLKSLEELHISNNPNILLPDLALKYLGCEKIPMGNSAVINSRQSIIYSKMVDQSSFLSIYDLLGSNKWKEFVDGKWHALGPMVFDLGLHKRQVEPGYFKGMTDLYDFLRHNFGRNLSDEFYLQAHKIACSHFQGEVTQTNADKENVGVFRHEGVFANFPAPNYQVTAEGYQEFYQTKNDIINRLGVSFNLGEMTKVFDLPLTFRIVYGAMTQEQIRIVFNLFVSDFHSQIVLAQTKDDLLFAIAKLIRNFEWLHPPKDGCGRTDTAFLNFLLASFGFNPVLLKYPYVSSCVGLREWVETLKIGMKDWSEEVDKLSTQSFFEPDQMDDRDV